MLGCGLTQVRRNTASTALLGRVLGLGVEGEVSKITQLSSIWNYSAMFSSCWGEFDNRSGISLSQSWLENVNLNYLSLFYKKYNLHNNIYRACDSVWFLWSVNVENVYHRRAKTLPEIKIMRIAPHSQPARKMWWLKNSLQDSGLLANLKWASLKAPCGQQDFAHIGIVWPLHFSWISVSPPDRSLCKIILLKLFRYIFRLPLSWCSNSGEWNDLN